MLGKGAEVGQNGPGAIAATANIYMRALQKQCFFEKKRARQGDQVLPSSSGSGSSRPGLSIISSPAFGMKLKPQAQEPKTEVIINEQIKSRPENSPERDSGPPTPKSEHNQEID